MEGHGRGAPGPHYFSEEGSSRGYRGQGQDGWPREWSEYRDPPHQEGSVSGSGGRGRGQEDWGRQARPTGAWASDSEMGPQSDLGRAQHRHLSHQHPHPQGGGGMQHRQHTPSGLMHHLQPLPLGHPQAQQMLPHQGQQLPLVHQQVSLPRSASSRHSHQGSYGTPPAHQQLQQQLPQPQYVSDTPAGMSDRYQQGGMHGIPLAHPQEYGNVYQPLSPAHAQGQPQPQGLQSQVMHARGHTSRSHSPAPAFGAAAEAGASSRLVDPLGTATAMAAAATGALAGVAAGGSGGMGGAVASEVWLRLEPLSASILEAGSEAEGALGFSSGQLLGVPLWSLAERLTMDHWSQAVAGLTTQHSNRVVLRFRLVGGEAVQRVGHFLGQRVDLELQFRAGAYGQVLVGQMRLCGEASGGAKGAPAQGDKSRGGASQASRHVGPPGAAPGALPGGVPVPRENSAERIHADLKRVIERAMSTVTGSLSPMPAAHPPQHPHPHHQLPQQQHQQFMEYFPPNALDQGSLGPPIEGGARQLPSSQSEGLPSGGPGWQQQQLLQQGQYGRKSQSAHGGRHYLQAQGEVLGQWRGDAGGAVGSEDDRWAEGEGRLRPSKTQERRLNDGGTRGSGRRAGAPEGRPVDRTRSAATEQLRAYQEEPGAARGAAGAHPAGAHAAQGNAGQDDLEEQLVQFRQRFLDSLRVRTSQGQGQGQGQGQVQGQVQGPWQGRGFDDDGARGSQAGTGAAGRPRDSHDEGMPIHAEAHTGGLPSRAQGEPGEIPGDVLAAALDVGLLSLTLYKTTSASGAPGGPRGLSCGSVIRSCSETMAALLGTPSPQDLTGCRLELLVEHPRQRAHLEAWLVEICANHSNPARWHKLVSITLTGPSGAPVAVDITPIQLLLAPPPSVTPLGGGGGTTPSLVLHAAVALAPDPTVRNPSALGIGTDGGPGDGYAEGVPGEPLAPLSPYRPSTTVKPRGVPSDSGLALGATLGSGEDPSGAVSSAVSAALAKQHKELMEAVARDVGGPLRVIEGLASELLEGQELEGAPGARSHVALIRSSARSLNGVLEHLSELLKPGSELQVSGTGRLVAPSEVRSARAQPRAAEGALEERGGGLREPQSESEASGRRELAPEAREAGAAAPEPTMHALMDFKMQEVDETRKELLERTRSGVDISLWERLGRIQVLVFDPDEVHLRVAAAVLGAVSVACHTVTTQEQCIERIASHDPFDLILLACDPKDKASLQTAVHIRGIEHVVTLDAASAVRMRSCIVAVTPGCTTRGLGEDEDEDEEHCAAEIDYFIPKPVRLSDLQMVLKHRVEVLRSSKLASIPQDSTGGTLVHMEPLPASGLGSPREGHTGGTASVASREGAGGVGALAFSSERSGEGEAKGPRQAQGHSGAGDDASDEAPPEGLFPRTKTLSRQESQEVFSATAAQDKARMGVMPGDLFPFHAPDWDRARLGARGTPAAAPEVTASSRNGAPRVAPKPVAGSEKPMVSLDSAYEAAMAASRAGNGRGVMAHQAGEEGDEEEDAGSEGSVVEVRDPGKLGTRKSDITALLARLNAGEESSDEEAEAQQEDDDDEDYENGDDGTPGAHGELHSGSQTSQRGGSGHGAYTQMRTGWDKSKSLRPARSLGHTSWGELAYHGLSREAVGALIGCEATGAGSGGSGSQPSEGSPLNPNRPATTAPPARAQRAPHHPPGTQSPPSAYAQHAGPSTLETLADVQSGEGHRMAALGESLREQLLAALGAQGFGGAPGEGQNGAQPPGGRKGGVDEGSEDASDSEEDSPPALTRTRTLKASGDQIRLLLRSRTTTRPLGAESPRADMNARGDKEDRGLRKMKTAGPDMHWVEHGLEGSVGSDASGR